MSAPITPTVGRIVLYHPTHEQVYDATDPAIDHTDPPRNLIALIGKGPIAASIAHVHAVDNVNLCIIDSLGRAIAVTGVYLWTEDAMFHRPDRGFCEWMPYQKGQAAKTEDVTATLRKSLEAALVEISSLRVAVNVLLAERRSPSSLQDDIQRFAERLRKSGPKPVHQGKIYPLTDEGDAPDPCEVFVLDEPGPGGGHHLYSVRVGKDEHFIHLISFQKGSVADNGHNGASIEAYIAICKHRLACFQAGPFPCAENEHAWLLLSKAMHALQTRTRRRIAMGIEGALIEVGTTMTTPAPAAPRTSPPPLKLADGDEPAEAPQTYEHPPANPVDPAE